MESAVPIFFWKFSAGQKNIVHQGKQLLSRRQKNLMVTFERSWHFDKHTHSVVTPVQEGKTFPGCEVNDTFRNYPMASVDTGSKIIW